MARTVIKSCERDSVDCDPTEYIRSLMFRPTLMNDQLAGVLRVCDYSGHGACRPSADHGVRWLDLTIGSFLHATFPITTCVGDESSCHWSRLADGRHFVRQHVAAELQSWYVTAATLLYVCVLAAFVFRPSDIMVKVCNACSWTRTKTRAKMMPFVHDWYITRTKMILRTRTE